MIPLIDLTHDKKTNRKIQETFSAILDSNSYILGKRLESFEKKFAKFLGVRYAIGVANGTDAIRLGLSALGIGRGDKVLTVAFTSPFTAIGIIEAGAIPVFCDVDFDTWTMDLDDAEKRIDSKTRAIMPVHIYGNPCDMIRVNSLAKKYKLKVIEDACQAHGATLNGKKVGSFADVAAFSFYPTKNLGGLGDGGAVVTNSTNLAKKIKLMRQGGQTKRFWHETMGINSRLDEIQAAVLEIKLSKLKSYNRKRALLAAKYEQRLQGLPIVFQKTLPDGKSSNHLLVIRTKVRDKLKIFLSKAGIISDIYYPYPVHTQTAFKKFKKGELINTQILTRELLALPLSPNLSVRDHDKVIKAINTFFSTI